MDRTKALATKPGADPVTIPIEETPAWIALGFRVEPLEELPALADGSPSAPVEDGSASSPASSEGPRPSSSWEARAHELEAVIATEEAELPKAADHGELRAAPDLPFNGTRLQRCVNCGSPFVLHAGQRSERFRECSNPRCGGLRW